MKTVILFALLAVVFGLHEHHPNNPEFIEKINKAQNLWTAGAHTHFENVQFEDLYNVYFGVRPVVPPENKEWEVPTHNNYVDPGQYAIPLTFDARVQWSTCEWITEVRDQGFCASDWALTAAATITDRYCTMSKTHIRISGQQTAFCSSKSVGSNTCTGGGFADGVVYEWEHYGYTNGLAYSTTASVTACQGYKIPPCDHFDFNPNSPYFSTSTCGLVNVTTAQQACSVTACDNPAVTYQNHTGNGSYKFSNQTFSTDTIKVEILNNGPVISHIYFYPDWFSYKTGIYFPTALTQGIPQTYNFLMARHAVKIVGWGIDDQENPYWIAVNSYNQYWGDNGTFKIYLGINAAGIEEEIICPIPNGDIPYKTL